MKQEVKDQLLDLNREFYRRFSSSFADSRSSPQPGFHRLPAYFPSGQVNILDVGCGEGRFGRFLNERDLVKSYTGVDFSENLLNIARDQFHGEFLLRDLSSMGCLDGLGQYDVIVCLATLQHIPGRDNRLRLLQEMSAHVDKKGKLVLSNWQFLSSERQRRKLIDWSQIGLSIEDVEPGDYLLTWKREGLGLRYVAHIDPKEMKDLAHSLNLVIDDQFRSDGREGDLNLYTVLSVLM